MKTNFTHLHLHTSYSLSFSTIDIDKLIKLAKKNKIKSLAITDHLNVFAAIKFYQKCIDNKIKPIIGCQIPIKLNESDISNSIVTILCQNIKGYKHLIKLLSEIHVQKKSSELASASINHLKKYNEGLIVLTGGRNGVLGKNILSDKKDMQVKFSIKNF